MKSKRSPFFFPHETISREQKNISPAKPQFFHTQTKRLGFINKFRVYLFGANSVTENNIQNVTAHRNIYF